MATNTKSTAESSSTTPRRLIYARIIQNFHLVWLDRNIDETNDDGHNSMTKLREVINMVNTFLDVDECMNFIKEIGEKAFVLISGEFTQDIIPIVQDISQVHSIYIYSESNVLSEKWTKESPKVAGVYTDITSICEALKKATQNYDHNSVSVSYVKKTNGITNQDLDTLDPSFMYTQILKEILLTIEFEPVHFNEFVMYCRKQFDKKSLNFHKVNQIEKEYHRDQAIRWYTGAGFLYTMLNRALRTMEADLIINMGFFVRDLHNQIDRLHSEQYGGLNHSNSFTVYRGQSLSKTDFNQLKTTQGGLISFNNFLSTSFDREVSLGYAESNRNNPDLIGVLFEININSSIPSTPFANVKSFSSFEEEEEILFSMHSVCRIGQIQQIEENDRLWQVELTLTSENDSQLQDLTKIMRDETEGSTGWFRLGRLMMKVAHFDKAEQLFRMMLDGTTDEQQKGEIYYYLGWIKYDQGNNIEAITYSEDSLKIRQKTLPRNHPPLAASYNIIGLVYDHMGKYLKALSSYEKALEIQQKSLPTNHPDLAGSYNNIGLVYDHMGEYLKALSSYEKALGILQKALPENHPGLATSYNNIGGVYDKMGEYLKALSSYEKALEIRQKSLPANHPDFAGSYNNIGLVYDKMGEYLKALSSCEKALEISQKTLPINHADLATSYNNIGLVYYNMGEYSKALSSYEKALEIQQKTLPANHPALAATYNNIGSVYDKMGKYSEALSYYEKTLEIQQKTLPANHSDLARCYNNIGLVYHNMRKYSKALSYYEEALGILQKALPENHLSLAISYNNIGGVYDNMGEYSKALSSLEKALGILQETLPVNHPYLASSYSNIGSVYYKVGEYSKALSYLEHALDIRQHSHPSSHPELKNLKMLIEIAKKKCK